MTEDTLRCEVGAPGAGAPTSRYDSLAEVTAETLTFARHLALDGLAGVNATPEEWSLALARSLTLSAVGTFDYPWLILDLLGWDASDMLKNLFGGMTDSVTKAATQAVTGVLADVGNLIWSGLSLLGGWIQAGVTGAANLLGYLFSTALSTAAVTIGSWIVGGADIVGSWVSYGAGIVRAGLGDLGGLVALGLGDLGNLAAAGINAGVGVLSGTIGWGVNVYASVAGSVGGAVTNAIGAGFGGLGQVFLSGVGMLGDVLSGTAMALWGAAGTLAMMALQAAIDLAGLIKQYVIDPLVSVGQAAVQWVSDELAGIASGDPESALGLAGGLMLAAVPLGIGAHALSIAAEHSHPLKQVGYGLISRELVEMTNLRTISQVTFGEGYKLALGLPMQYWLSRRIRPQIPAVRDLMTSYTKGDIGQAELDLSMAYHGFDDQRIAYMTESAWQEPRAFILRRLVDSGVVPETWLRAKLRRNMYRDEDVDVIATALMHNQFATQRTALWSAAWALLKDGASTPDRFAADVAPLGMPDGQIALGVRSAALAHAADMVNYQSSTLLTQTKDGQISVDDFGLALAALGVVPDRVALEQARARVAITGKIAATATAAAAAGYRKVQQEGLALWVERFRRGLIDAVTLTANLIALGYDPDLANITTQIEVARQTPLVPVKADTSVADNLIATRDELRKAYVDEYRVGLIDDATLKMCLMAIGLSESLADAIVVDEMAKGYVPPPSTPSPAEEAAARSLLAAQEAYARDLYRAEYITADEYLTALTDAGMAPDLAAVTVERERLRLDVINAKASAPAGA